ncbi:MAG: hypothetical protein IJ071_11475 [Ruminococcus sp.]|nr:hypothetical protein [Ruminococcus sp.]
MKRITAALLLTAALLGTASCSEEPSESDPSESGRPESSSSAPEPTVSPNDLALAIKNAHMEQSAAFPEDPVFGRTVALGRLENGDVFGDRLLPVIPEAEGGEYLLIHRENGSLRQVFVRYPGSDEIGCAGEHSDASDFGAESWEELAAACEAAGGLPYEAETFTLTADELCRSYDRAVAPELTVTGDPELRIWLEIEEPSLSMVGYMGSGYTFYADGEPDSALLTLTYDPELILAADQSPEHFQPAMYRCSSSGGLEEVADQTVKGCSVTAPAETGNTYILANKKELEEFWSS